MPDSPEQILTLARKIETTFNPPIQDFDARCKAAGFEGGVAVVGMLGAEAAGFAAEFVITSEGVSLSDVQGWIEICAAKMAAAGTTTGVHHVEDGVKNVHGAGHRLVEIVEAFARSGLDLAPCAACDLPVMIVPDGMPTICTDCEKDGRKP